MPRKSLVVLALVLIACEPKNVGEAEKKKNVAWLVSNASPEAIGALGRLADNDKTAETALETFAQRTIGQNVTDAGVGGIDVYLAAWGAVERNAGWGTVMFKRALADTSRMNDAASAMKRGSPQLASFVADLDGALRAGCDVRCGSALASVGAAATNEVEHRLGDDKTRDAMCAGLGSQESTKETRAIFVRVPESSRNAPGCVGAAARMAARDDDVLAWLAKSAEPGLLRSMGISDALTCDRVVRIWTTALSSRPHNTYGALSIPLGSAVKRCAKALDPLLAASLVADPETQTLAVAAIDPLDASINDLTTTCAALPAIARTRLSPPTQSRAQDALAKCKR